LLEHVYYKRGWREAGVEQPCEQNLFDMEPTSIIQLYVRDSGHYC
jgi:hypothetical protein